jgi:hypothetical protein
LENSDAAKQLICDQLAPVHQMALALQFLLALQRIHWTR